MKVSIRTSLYTWNVRRIWLTLYDNHRYTWEQSQDAVVSVSDGTVFTQLSGMHCDDDDVKAFFNRISSLSTGKVSLTHDVQKDHTKTLRIRLVRSYPSMFTMFTTVVLQHGSPFTLSLSKFSSIAIIPLSIPDDFDSKVTDRGAPQKVIHDRGSLHLLPFPMQPHL